jgi:hypothetical protein
MKLEPGAQRPRVAFPNTNKLVGYLGLDPRVRQSGDQPAKHGRISKQGSAHGRHALVSGLERGAPARPAARLLPAGPRPARPPGRDRRQRPQARMPLLVHAHPRRGLRLRPTVTDQEKAPPPRAHRRRPQAQGTTAIWSTNDAMRQAERALASRPNSPTAATSPTGKQPARQRRARVRHRGTHLESPRRAKAAWQTRAPDACASLRQSLAPDTESRTDEHAPSTPLDFRPSRNALAREPCPGPLRIVHRDSADRLGLRYRECRCGSAATARRSRTARDAPYPPRVACADSATRSRRRSGFPPVRWTRGFYGGDCRHLARSSQSVSVVFSLTALVRGTRAWNVGGGG